MVRRCIWRIYYPRLRSEEVCSMSYCKLPMTKVEDSMIHDIHHLTMVHIIYTILCGRIT